MGFYLIITTSTAGIGGAELYVLRKAQFMSKKGYKVLIITAKSKPLMIRDFQNFPVLTEPSVSYPCYWFTRSYIKKAITRMTEFVLDCGATSDGLFVESTYKGNSTWAELLSRKLNVRSLIYETNGLDTKEKTLANFLAFKAKRGELLGCSRFSNQKLFANFPEYYDERKNLYVNVPFDNSEIVDDTKGTVFSKDPNTLRILTVSRIEKKYLIYLIGEVSKVAQVIPNKTIELTMVLSRRKGKEFSILEKQSMNLPENLKVSFLGPIVPLSKSLFLTHNVFVGMGTASLNAISMGMPTILADSKSNLSTGVLGVDVDYFGYAPAYESTIAEQLQRFLDNPTLFMEASERGLSLFQEEYESSAVMNKFMEHVERIMKQEPEYYSFDKVSLSGREKLKKAVMSIAGVKGYDFLAKFYARHRTSK